ncbi:hypothetical protein M0638_01175, partial [Roseomonas sp. NAR14]|nr:hypothetical protein [Roseomonas acroporae]
PPPPPTAGSAEAAAALARTHDPEFLASIGARIAPDPATAILWYRRAAALGDAGAPAALRRLEPR